MMDIVLSPQTIALVGGLMSALVITISVLSGVVALLYRQVLRERERLLEERDARLVDLWRDIEEKEIRITALEGANERLQKLASDATDGWRISIEDARTRLP